ncbi:MAG TPA: chemotaxis protein CheW [bacterium]|nr:chemotaxis protein CheW [bacterium]
MSDSLAVLVVQAHGLSLALPLAAVLEVYRPLPTQTVSGAPAFVRGLARIRGRATVVVDLNRLLGAPQDAEAGRYVSLRMDGRSVALAVESARELRTLDSAILAGLPPLLGEGGERFQALASLDEGLLVVLSAAKLLPEGDWERSAESGS